MGSLLEARGCIEGGLWQRTECCCPLACHATSASLTRATAKDQLQRSAKASRLQRDYTYTALMMLSLFPCVAKCVCR